MRAISIMYHDIVRGGESDASGFPGPDAALYKLEPDQFASHLDAIAKAVRRSPGSVFDLLKAEHQETPLLITFDDGGASAPGIADMLEHHGWRGHFFITTGYIGTPSFMSRDQILELHRRGHVIGSHSSSHPARMSHCDWEEMLREWKTSVELLSDILGEQVRAASVPGGYYSRRVAEAASVAGIEALFTSEPTTRCRMVDRCLVLGRYTIQRWMSSEVAAALAAGRVAPGLRQLLFWNAKKATKALGGERYLKMRKALLGRM
jgi:peptidoglycan/xylan/chitin deacetylase (PgdA/CDA1 family)